MNVTSMKRALVRKSRLAHGLQWQTKHQHGEMRNYKSPEARRVVAGGRAILALHPEWR